MKPYPLRRFIGSIPAHLRNPLRRNGFSGPPLAGGEKLYSLR